MDSLKSSASFIARVALIILIAAAPFAAALGVTHALGGLVTISFASALQWGVIALLLGLSLDRFAGMVARGVYFLSGLSVFHTQALGNVIGLVLLTVLYFFVTENIWFALLASLIHIAVAAMIDKIIPD